jgi:hypothetical protein
MQEETRIVGGVSYTISQSMVRRRRPSTSPLVERVVQAIALAFGIPIFAVVGPLWYMLMFNKRISQRLISNMIPLVMPAMDKALRNTKLELLKDLHGRILDVGCGDGAWLRYFSKAAYVTELEPNPFLIPKIQDNVAAFRSSNPGVEVEVVNKFVHELDPTAAYDVSPAYGYHRFKY